MFCDVSAPQAIFFSISEHKYDDFLKENNVSDVINPKNFAACGGSTELPKMLEKKPHKNTPPCFKKVGNKGGGILSRGGILNWNTPDQKSLLMFQKGCRNTSKAC